jgi:hypothetical protein
MQMDIFFKYNETILFPLNYLRTARSCNFNVNTVEGPPLGGNVYRVSYLHLLTVLGYVTS